MNDELHGITGISNLTIADYLVGLAEKSKSAQVIYSRIIDNKTVKIFGINNLNIYIPMLVSLTQDIAI